MDLPNTYFQDFPIEFKEINPEDFPNCLIENNDEKLIITPNEQGYISNQLSSLIEVRNKNTVVVNAAVGQGKTTAIVDIIKNIYEDNEEDYLIMVAAPFVSLVEQYVNEIIGKGVPREDIYRYESITKEPNINYLTKKVHIITVNGILGNPGEDAFINSERKRVYLKRLSDYCKAQNRKVILIMDEIHDAIHNFKQEYIFNLWKWKGILHKNIILSATYNEASKVVIEYLAELTDNKIKIIESERVIIPENQSKLFLHFNPAIYYKYDNADIMNVVDEIIKRDRKIDVLCYSKKLAEDIVKKKDEGVGMLLYSKYGVLNKCTSEPIKNNNEEALENEDSEQTKNTFDNSKCNVGTNFKTGISITKRKHAFVIIFPPLSSKIPFSKSSGIFSDGINSVIQSLARQRKKGGEIHLILPPPGKFNYTTLPFSGERKEKFIEFYDYVCEHKEDENAVSYIPYNNQKRLLKNFYQNVLLDNISNEIQLVNNTDREGMLSLKMPDFKTYLLSKGEKFLATKYKFFGQDLSSYITYCAITNQFINCNLSGFSVQQPLGFKEGEFQIALDYFFENYYLSEDRYFNFNYTSDFYRYLELKNDLFEYYKLKMLKRNGRLISIKKDKIKHFELQLLGFIHRRLHPSFQENFMHNGELFDYEYTRSDYFSNCIVIAEQTNLESITITGSENYIKRVKAFKSLNYFRNKLLASKSESFSSSKGNFEYVLKKPNSDFISTNDVDRFNEMINYLINDDYFISKGIFEFKQRFTSDITTAKKIKSLYTKLIEDFLETEEYRLTTGRRPKVNLIVSYIELPNPEETMDFISEETFEFTEDFWEQNTYNLIDGQLIKRDVTN